MSFDLQIAHREASDLEAAMDLAARCFGRDDASRLLERERHVAVPERWLVARLSGQEIGQVGVHPLALSVPGGGTVAAAGITWVGVLAAASGKGVMHRLMRAAHGRARQLGEAIAVLDAAQPRMYQSLGYGVAVREVDLLLHPTDIPAPSARVNVHEVDPGDVGEALTEVTARLATALPGVPVVGLQWAKYRIDPLSGGARRGSMRAGVATAAGSVCGVVLWSKANSPPEDEDLTVVHELLAIDEASSVALCNHLRDAVPAAMIKVSVGPGDPLISSVPNPRAAATAVRDRLHVRVLDFRAAMACRVATADVDAVLEILPLRGDDESVSVRWRLRASAGERFDVTPTTQRPQVRMRNDALGSLYLGDAVLGDLVRGSRAETDGSEPARALGWALRGETSPCTPVAF